MKKIFLSTFSMLLLLCLLVSCVSEKGTADSDTTYDRLSAIESQLASLLAEESKDSDVTQDTQDISDVNADSDTQLPQDTSQAVEKKVGFTYDTDGDTATITGYVGDEVNLVIPNSIDGYKICAIGDSAFRDTRIKSVIIPNGVESVGWFAFDGCTRLGAVTVPSTVTQIGYGAFGSADSSLTLYCHEGSFAQKYARSYGLAYAII